MSLVIITGEGPEHRYVANQIVKKYPVTAILIVDSPPKRSWKQILKKSLARFIDKTLRQIYLRVIGDKALRDETLHMVLGREAAAFISPELITRVGYPKDNELLEKTRQLAPSVIAVYGTGIIPDSVLSQAKTVSLNMHTGISPWYRGVSCYLWPMINGEFDKVGATVHECIAKVDGGRIFYTGVADIRGVSNIHGVFAQAVKVGTKGYVEVLGQALSGKLVGSTQDLTIGREYQGSIVGIVSELSARRALSRWLKTTTSSV